MHYCELTLAIPTPLAEQVGWSLTELGLGGVVLSERKPDEAPGPTTDLKIYLPRVEGAPRLAEVREAIGRAVAAADAEATFEVRLQDLAEEDWATSWQQYWHVQHIGERLVVRPSWEAYEPRPGQCVIVLDPKMAFGTGTHATTRLCLRAVERLAAQGPLGEVYDVGAGSGILAIAALLLGAPRAIAVDNDPVAVASAAENAAINHVSDRLESRLGSAADLPGAAPVVFANILAEVIVALAEPLAAVTAPGGHLLASGILARKAESVQEALHAVGFATERVDREGDWVGLVMRRIG